MYITLDKLVTVVFANRDKTASDNEISKFLDKVCSEKIEPYIDSCYQELADFVNAFDQKMKM